MHCELCGEGLTDYCTCFDKDPKKKIIECIRIAEKEFRIIERVMKGENFYLKIGQTTVPFARVEHTGCNLILTANVPILPQKRKNKWRLFHKKQYMRFAFLDSSNKELFWQIVGPYDTCKYDDIAFTWSLGFG